jgi:hypothetical protein
MLCLICRKISAPLKHADFTERTGGHEADMTHPTERQFGLVFAAFLAAIALVWWLLFDAVLAELIGLAGLLALTALALPQALLPMNRLWRALAHRIAVANTYLLLGAVMLLVLAPARLFLALAGRDPLQRRRDPAASSYFEANPRRVTADTYRDQF